MSSINLVKQFHLVFNHPIGEHPELPDYKTMVFRTSFMQEELLEAGEAHDKHDLVDFADSLGDLQYVLDGWFLNSGLHGKKDAIMEEIHRSNMTKACKTQAEAIETMDKLSAANPEITYHTEQVGQHHIVYRSHDRKVMKSINYELPNLKPIIYG